MGAGNRIEITDKEGWRKEVSLDKRLIYVGSDARNDIVLNPARGAGVSPRHMQLIALPGGSSTFSAVNLSGSGIALGDGGSRVLDPNSAMEVADGEQFHLGDFTLVFHMQDNGLMAVPPVLTVEQPPQLPPARPNGSAIGLRVSLPQAVLSPEMPLEGVLYVSNLGTAPGVQFTLGLEGLPPDCCEIGPAPILFPGAEKGVQFRLYHPRRPGFPPGGHKLTFQAETSEAYPGEHAVVSREIRFLPYYSHTLRVLSVE